MSEVDKRHCFVAFCAGFAEAGFPERATNELFESYYANRQNQKAAFRKWWAEQLPPTPWQWWQFATRESEHKPGTPTDWLLAPEALRVFIEYRSFIAARDAQIREFQAMSNSRPYLQVRNYSDGTWCNYPDGLCMKYNDSRWPKPILPCWRYDCGCKLLALSERDIERQQIKLT